MLLAFIVFSIVFYLIGLLVVFVSWDHDGEPWPGTKDYPIVRKIVICITWPVTAAIELTKYLNKKMIIPITKEFKTGTWWDKKE